MGTYSEEHTLIGIDVTVDLGIDFQEILQKSSVFHKSYIEKHLEFLSEKRQDRAIS